MKILLTPNFWTVHNPYCSEERAVNAMFFLVWEQLMDCCNQIKVWRAFVSPPLVQEIKSSCFESSYFNQHESETHYMQAVYS